MKTFEGKLVAKEVKVGIVAARFNEFITSKLIGGAEDCLLRHDVKQEDIRQSFLVKLEDFKKISIEVEFIFSKKKLARTSLLTLEHSQNRQRIGVEHRRRYRD